MARTPKIRTNYNADAQFLLRLAQAVESDRKRPKEWRSNIASKLTALAGEFINAPEAQETGQNGEA